MSDKEMLELAAKAAGYRIDSDFDRLDVRQASGAPTPWRPLDDDGDALRLAVKLNLCVVVNGMFVHVEMHNCTLAWRGYVEENSARNSGCIFKATRRAIVRAAALIGEETP